MNLHTRDTILSLGVMGAVHAADEGVGPVQQDVCICVCAIVLDQKPSRSLVVFRLNVKPTGCWGKVEFESQVTVLPWKRQVWWDTLLPVGRFISGVDLGRKWSERNEVHKKKKRKCLLLSHRKHPKMAFEKPSFFKPIFHFPVRAFRLVIGQKETLFGQLKNKFFIKMDIMNIYFWCCSSPWLAKEWMATPMGLIEYFMPTGTKITFNEGKAWPKKLGSPFS